jgi:glycerophosphoryl diester phosphodiesterase
MEPAVKPFLVIAHRGASGAAPENTQASLRLAMDLHADMIEVDVRLSRDGVPILSHDATLERCTGHKIPLDSLTLEELRRYDFGGWFSSEFTGEPIPTLEEALHLVCARAPLNIEIKTDGAVSGETEERVVELVVRMGIEDQVLVSSFDERVLQSVRRDLPRVKLGVLYDGRGDWQAFLQRAEVLKAAAFHPEERSVTPEMVRTFHRSRIRVYPYVVDAPERAAEFRHWQVDGVFTNYPGRFRNTSA